ncbi:MAG: hypothetical protein HQM06_09125 [Magnetococcales bacterium]|nr:hypothetical protein [Magnetococcales bacterium]
MSGASPSQELLILLFACRESRLGIEARQVARTLRWQEGVAINNFSYFHQQIDWQEEPPPYSDPFLLFPAPQLQRQGSLLVDRLQGLLAVPYRQLRPWPPGLIPRQNRNPYWAIALPASGPILLLDLAVLLPPAVSGSASD